MRALLVLLLMWHGLAGSAAAAETDLVCPALPDGKTCSQFHYHVDLYRPDSKTRFVISANRGFATPAACEQAREAHIRRNIAVVDHFTLLKVEQHEPDRVGPCHCDR